MRPTLLYNSGFTMYPLRGLVNHINIGRLRSYSGSGSIANDLQGANNFNLVSSPAYSSSNNGVLTLNGTSQYLNGAGALNFTNSDFSISVWVKLNSLTTNVGGQGPCILFKGLYGVSGYYLQCGTNGSIFFVSSHPTATVSSTPMSVIAINNWYNITVTKTGTSVRIYVNGIDRTNSAGSHGTITSSSRDFTVGLYQNINIFSNMVFSSLLSYNRGLTAGEVTQIFYNSKNIYGL